MDREISTRNLTKSLHKYNQIIFDFDGTIVDSNKIKKDAIVKASKDYCLEKYHKKFIKYFIRNNGIPREIKINNFFIKEDAIKILYNYNKILKEAKHIPLTNGSLSAISYLADNKKLLILSGGEKSEIIKLLKYHKLKSYFHGIYTAPKNKYDNITELNLKGKSLYIGDSIIDYEVSTSFNCDFVFMYEYTQFEDWKTFFKDKKIYIIKNLQELIQEVKC